MIRAVIALVALLTASWQGASAYAQGPAPASKAVSAKTWIGHETQIEEILKTAEIVRLQEVGIGVTRPRRGFLEGSDLVTSLTWKMLPPGRRGGFWESYKSEIAAYQLDRLLALNMVPPAVEREVNGERGAAVMWVEPTTSVKEMGGTLNSGHVAGHWIRKMEMFDNLIGNPDRNAGNILVDGVGNVILIDHSRAFIDKKDLPVKFERVDADLLAAIEALDAGTLRREIGALVGERAIDAMIERRTRMRAAVDKLVAKKGRDQVIIPAGR